MAKVLTQEKAIDLLQYHLIVPEGYTCIDEDVFAHTQIMKVTLPETLKTIRKQAFMYCTDLKEINIPKSVSQIGFQAFSMCESLETITLSGNIRRIDSTAFHGCDKLVVRCPENSYAHRYCKRYNINFKLI